MYWKVDDDVAEWLRRWIANPLLYERVSSNLTVVEFTFISQARSSKLLSSFFIFIFIIS